MIRIHFTPADLGRVTLPAEPSPLWDAALAARVLPGRHAAGDVALTPVARRWRRTAAARVRSSMRPLFKLIAPTGDFPDFLTPSMPGLEPGVEALMDTPAEVIRDELGPWLPADLEPFMDGLLAGSSGSRRALGTAVLDFHREVLAPSAAELERRHAADLALRSRDLMYGGLDALLAHLHPDVDWSPPVLTAHGLAPARTLDVHLEGRGLQLYPSPFVADCLALDVPGERPVLVYPCLDYPIDDPVEAITRGIPDPTADALAALLGRTRAQVLRSLQTPASTSQLARRLSISLPTTSDHTRILRAAGLITTHRPNGSTLHSLTPAARHLLSGATRSVQAQIISPVRPARHT